MNLQTDINDMENLTMIQQRAHEWRLRLEDPEASDETWMAFHQWLDTDPQHQDAYRRAESTWLKLEAVDRSRLDPELIEINNKPATYNWRALIAIAASIVLMSIIAIPLMTVLEPSLDEIVASTETNHQSGKGEIKELVLTDDTKVTLDADSQITIKMYNDKRTVKLTRGQAFFNVTDDKQRPFIVSGADLNVTVVGTQFSVKVTETISRVAVAEGKVDVSYPIFINGKPQNVKEKIALTAGQQISANDSSGMKQLDTLGDGKIAQWRYHKLTYLGATLGEIIADANRHSSVRIVLNDDELSWLPVTASFHSNDIDTMLKTLANTLELSINQQVNGDINISGKE
ncbi:MAG: FecR domain-containing protein [Pseudomonadota bacterium]